MKKTAGGGSMEKVEATRKTRDALLGKPFDIYHGTGQLISIGAVVMGYMLFAGILVFELVRRAGHVADYSSGTAIASTVIFTILAALAPWLFYYRLAEPWLNSSKPVLTLSSGGIALRGKPVIRWSEYQEARICSIDPEGGMLAFLVIGLKDGGKARLFLNDLRIEDNDLLRLFELYHAAFEGRLAVTP
jgi:hypothetical protein